MWLIIGLGNPETSYQFTRHNIGFRTLDFLSPNFKRNKKVSGETTKLFIDEQEVLLLKPHTYMNLSGNAVQAALSYYKLSPSNLIVIYDDIDYSFGTIRLAKSGGAAGHNGLTHIISQLGTDQFIRIRIGIQSKIKPQKAENFVLKNFSKEEEKEIPIILQTIQQSLQLIVTQGIEEAMQIIHSKT